MRILVVEDDLLYQEAVSMVFSDHAVIATSSGEEAIDLLGKVPYNLLFLDIKLKGQLTGVDVLKKAREIDPLLPIVMVSGLDDRPTITQCLEMGAFDYVVKGSVSPSAYKYLVHKASVWRSQQVSGAVGTKHVITSSEDTFSLIKGSSAQTKELRDKISVLGKTDGPFLIMGETGTGKELVAKSIWQAKGNKSRPFITVNCAEFQGTTIEGELFGFEKGAFTGANAQRIGLFEAAHGGDIFLDEIGELPLEFQAKLLRVIQEKKIRRMGSNVQRTFDFRIIAATNRDLATESEAGRFRSDLFYRLDVDSMSTTPLRERQDDIIDLLQFFFVSDGILGLRIELNIRTELLKYGWPGNVRQLASFAKFIAPYLDGVDPHITTDQWKLWQSKRQNEKQDAVANPKETFLKLVHSGSFKYDQYSDNTRANFIQWALEIAENNRSEAARLLGVSRQRLVNWLSEIG